MKHWENLHNRDNLDGSSFDMATLRAGVMDEVR